MGGQRRTTTKIVNHKQPKTIEETQQTNSFKENTDQWFLLFPIGGVVVSIGSIFVVIGLYKWKNQDPNNPQKAEEENELVKQQSLNKV